MSRFTFKNPDGSWGLVNGNVSEVPYELYGAMYKLKDYEETGLNPEEVEELIKKSNTHGKRINCFVNGKLTGDSCFGCDIIAYECDLCRFVVGEPPEYDEKHPELQDETCPDCNTALRDEDGVAGAYCPGCGMKIIWPDNK